MQPAAGISGSRRTRSSCKDRLSGASISRFAVAVSRFEFAVGTPAPRPASPVTDRFVDSDLMAVHPKQCCGEQPSKRPADDPDSQGAVCMHLRLESGWVGWTDRDRLADRSADPADANQEWYRMP